MINKKHNNKGSAFAIVIIAMALFLTIMFIVSFQTNYQIKTSSNLYMDMQQKYLSESGIDKVIADISSGIESELKGIKTVYSYNSISTYSDVKDPHEGHEPVRLDMNEIRNISNNIVSNNIYNGSNGLGQIYNDLYNMNLGNGGISLKNNLYNDINQLRDNIWSNLGSSQNSFIFELSDYVHYNNIKDRNDLGYQTRVNEIGLYIDGKIKEILKIQQDLNKLYDNTENKNDNLKNQIESIQNKLENVKYYLEEVKCKLGIKITGNTGEDDNDSSDSSDSSNSSETITININIPHYKFPNESTYKLDGYETKGLSIPVTINYINGSISSVDPITVDNIISIGYKDNKEYKISANITFNIGKEGNVYRVLSYKVNDWEKI